MISSLRVRLDKLETKAKHVPSNEDRKTTRQDSQLERVRTSIQQKYGMLGCALYRVPPDYYSRSLYERAKLLQAPVEALCKTMIVENTMVDKQSISDPENPLKNRCFAVLLQYCTKLDTERLAKQLRNMALERYPAEEAPSFKLKMAEAEDSYKLTGYEFNAITPFGTTNELPLILSRNIVRQQSEGTFRYVWLGGGDPDLKLRLFVKQVQTKYKPAVFVVECTEARNEYMDEQE